jgi:uncharacterized protein (TIGR03435 family)
MGELPVYALVPARRDGKNLGRIVIDETGLKGKFDADLEFSPENIPQCGPGT